MAAHLSQRCLGGMQSISADQAQKNGAVAVARSFRLSQPGRGMQMAGLPVQRQQPTLRVQRAAVVAQFAGKPVGLQSKQVTPTLLNCGSLAFVAAGASTLYQVAEGLETPIQAMYLLTLLGFLSVGAFLVVRQVLIRRELDEAAKGLGERIRTGEASCEVRILA